MVRREGALVEYADGRVVNTATGEPQWSNVLDSMPRMRSAMDWSAYTFAEGDEVVLVFQPYLDFLATFKDDLAEAARAGQLRCSLNLQELYTTGTRLIVFGMVSVHFI